MKTYKIANIHNAPRTAGNISNIIGLVNESELDVINVKILKNLRHESIGLWNSATMSNPKAVEGGGTALFRITKVVQTKKYTAANRNDPGDTKKQEIRKFSIVGSNKVHTETETLDLQGMAAESKEGFLASTAASMGLTIAGLMDAHYIDIAIETAKAQAATQVIEIANLDDLNTTALQEAAYRTIARSKVAIARQLNMYNLGTDESDYATILHKNVQIDLLLAMPKNGNSATEIGRNLANGEQIIAGLGVVKDHVYLNKKIPAAQSFSLDEAFDFTDYFGIIAHREALFLAVQGLISTATTDPNSGNLKIITKFNYYKGAVRPELIVAFKKKP